MDNKMQIQALYSLLKVERAKMIDKNFINMLYAAGLSGRSKEITNKLKLLDKLADMTTLCIMQQNSHRAIRFYVAFKYEVCQLEKIAEEGMFNASIDIIDSEDKHSNNLIKN